MTHKTIAQVLSGISYSALENAPCDLEISGIVFRSDAVAAGDVFFCVPGFKSDGHDYAADAVSRGAAALVVQRPLPLDIPQYQVEDARRALALASANLFDKPSAALKVCGVTGTNGKTTTTYLVEWVAHQAGLKTGVIGTVETRIGDVKLPTLHTTPESRDLQDTFGQMRDAGCDLVAMEVSSHAIALDRIAGTTFAVAAFTNLTQDHLDFHHDMETYFLAKQALFDYPSVQARVICIDDEYGRRLAQHCQEQNLPYITVGRVEDADICAMDCKPELHSTKLTIKTPEGSFPLEFPLIGAFNVQNLLVAIGICHEAGIPTQSIIAAMEQAPQVPGRLQRVYTPDGRQGDFSIFVDYAHTPDSIEKALAAVSAVTPGKVHIVFGCGGDRDPLKRPLMGQAACAADALYVTSDNPRSEDPLAIIDAIVPGLEQAQGRYLIEPDRGAAIAAAIKAAGPGDAVLIAGKGHEDYQLVGDQVLHFDDREVAGQELARVLDQS